MKIIFLDIDGVLNADEDFGGRSKPNPLVHGICGISKTRIKRLKRIVDATNAKIVLVSSWKYDYRDYMRGNDNVWGKYLRNKLRKVGVEIFDDTYRLDNACGQDRGYEIVTWISESKEPVESWIVLDDEVFRDYKMQGIIPHLIKTSEKTGLTEELTNEAIKLLNKEI